MLFPEVGCDRSAAGEDQIGVVNGLVVEVVLGREPHRCSFDADVDVFAHEHHALIGKELGQGAHDGQNHIVSLVVWKACRQFAGIESEVLKIEFAPGFFVAERGQFHAVLNGSRA